MTRGSSRVVHFYIKRKGEKKKLFSISKLQLHLTKDKAQWEGSAITCSIAEYKQDYL